MLGLILTISQVIALAQRGLTVAKEVVDAVKAGHTVVTGDTGTLTLTAADVEAHLLAALGTLEKVGGDTADRIEDRHRGDLG